MLCPFRKMRVTIKTDNTEREREYFEKCLKEECPCYYKTNCNSKERCKMVDKEGVK